MTLKLYVEGLASAKAKLQDATFWLMQNGLANPDNAGAASTDYMHLFGLTGLAYMWALIAKAANAKIAGGRRRSLLRQQAHRRPLLRRTPPPRNRRPPRQAEDRLRNPDGPAGGGVSKTLLPLREKVARSAG